MNRKYALADCSLTFSFLSNYDLSCVYSSSTVDATEHCFTDVILQAMYLAVTALSLDSPNTLTVFPTQIDLIFVKIIIFMRNNKKPSIFAVNFLTFVILLKLHIILIHITGITV